MDTMLTRLKTRATALKADTYALYLAARDPRTPLLAKVLAMGVAAYALSPIDLIPDFVPVLGYLDDMLIVPIGLAAAIRLVPKDVMEECRAKALEGGIEKSRTAAVVIVLVWIAAIALVAYPVVRGVIGR